MLRNVSLFCLLPECRNVGNVTKCYSLLPIPPECSNVGNVGNVPKIKKSHTLRM